MLVFLSVPENQSLLGEREAFSGNTWAELVFLVDPLSRAQTLSTSNMYCSLFLY